MLDSGQHEQELREILTGTRARKDLTQKQRHSVNDIFANWSIRRASQAVKSKQHGEAVAILTDAQRELPNDRRIPAALASVYLQQHDWEKALGVYGSWNMTGANAGDYRSAAGAALSAHKMTVADHYLRQGLLLFPDDAELLHMTARQAVVRGDYKEGTRYLKLALAASRREESNPQSLKDESPEEALDRESAAALNAESAPPIPTATLSSSSSTPGCQVITGSTPSDLRVRPISLTSSDSNAPNIEETHNIQDEIDVVQDRNTPFVAATEMVSGRTGDAGFGRLIVEDGAMSSFYTATDKVRFGVEGHGVYAFSGSPTGSSTSLFGSLPQELYLANKARLVMPVKRSSR